MTGETSGVASGSVPARLLEREGELAQLRELIAAATRGEGAAAAVLGPAGIGKTSLLAAARELSRELGLTCLSARGGELERDFSYGVVRQLFERPLLELSDSERRSVMDGAALHAGPAVGLPAGGEEATAYPSFAVLHGLYWMCVNLAERGAIALVIDDLHWADTASLMFLSYLERRVGELPVLLLMAARPPAEGGAPADLVERVVREPGVLNLTLAPLSEAAVAALIAASIDGEPALALVRACHEVAAGNPFLCAAVVSALAEERVQGEAFDAPGVVELATAAVSSVVLRSLGPLAPPLAALARAVAVLGTDAQLRHAVALARLDGGEGVEAADALVAREILRGGAALDFTHPLVRAAVRQGIPSAERARLHAHAARLLFDEHGPPERAAVHLLGAEPAAEAWAVDTLRAAARRAASQGDPGAAASYLRRALREPPEPAARVAVLHELGVAELHAGEAGLAAADLDEAVRLAAGPRERADIARDLALALTTPGNYSEAAAVLERTAAELAELDRDLALRLEAELHQCAVMERSPLYARASERLAQLDHDVPGDTAGERALLAALATEGVLRTEPAAQVRERARRAFQRGLLEDQAPYSSLWGNAAFPLVFADGFAEAAPVAARALEDAQRRGSPIGSARAHAVRATLHFRQGDVRGAESDARTATELGLQAGFLVSLVPLGVLVESLVERGDLEAAEAALREAGRDGAIPERFLDNWVLHARARLRLAQRRAAEAIADYEDLGERGEHGWRAWNPGMFAYRSGQALALLLVGERERAHALATEELELARRWGAPRTIGASLRALGQVEGRERGVALLRESVETLERSGAELEHAHSLVELGAALRRSGQRSAAREPLHAGMELAHRCGAAALVRRAREELVATGARPRRIARTGVDALTPSELRVARMAAEGMTNREIAQALFVTLRTVQVHLTHTYQKLDISSRDQLPRELAGDNIG